MIQEGLIYPVGQLPWTSTKRGWNRTQEGKGPHMSREERIMKTIADWVATLGRLPVNDIGIPMNSLSKEEAEERGLILHENRWVTPDDGMSQARLRAETTPIMIVGLACVSLSAWSILALERSPLTPFLNPKLLEALVPFIAGVGLLSYRNWAWPLSMVVLVYVLLMCLENLVWALFLDDTRQRVVAVCGLFGYFGFPATILFKSTALRVFKVSKKRLLVSIVVALIVAPLGFVALYETDSRLIEACWRGNTEKAEFQLNLGANLNARDHLGYTPLRKAAYWGHPEIVRLLLRHGADPNEIGSVGATVLSDAVEADQVETVNALLGAGADPNATGNDGWTPLMMAALGGNPAIVKTLLKSGAEINARNKKGGTALMITVYHRHAEAARLLLQEGADLHARHEDGKTELELALSADNEEMVKLLREYGAKE